MVSSRASSGSRFLGSPINTSPPVSIETATISFNLSTLTKSPVSTHPLLHQIIVRPSTHRPRLLPPPLSVRQRTTLVSARAKSSGSRSIGIGICTMPCTTRDMLRVRWAFGGTRAKADCRACWQRWGECKKKSPSKPEDLSFLLYLRSLSWSLHYAGVFVFFEGLLIPILIINYIIPLPPFAFPYHFSRLLQVLSNPMSPSLLQHGHLSQASTPHTNGIHRA